MKNIAIIYRNVHIYNFLLSKTYNICIIIIIIKKITCKFKMHNLAFSYHLVYFKIYQ